MNEMTENMVEVEATPYKELTGIRQFVFTLGHIGPGMLSQFITTWLLMFLTGNADNVILSGTLVGIALLVGRIIDGVADPLVANWSDNIKSKKFGRRLPFMVLGTLPMILAFNMLWITESMATTEVGRFIWVLVWVNAFYFFYTVVVNPYFALLPELAKDKSQRIHIQSFVALFGIVGMGISLGASGFLITYIGYAGAGLVLSLVCAVSMVAPALVIKTNPDYEYKQSDKQTTNIFKNIGGAFKNKKFTAYIIGFATFYLGFQLVQYNMAFITTVQLGLDTGMSSVLFIVSVVCALAFIPLYNKFVKKLGPTNALKISMLAYAIVGVLIAVLPLTVSFLPPIVVGIFLMACIGFPYSGLMVIPNVLVSEIIDDDFAVTGVRREALFFGVQGLINKIMVAIAALLVGVLHDYLGNTVGDSLGVVIIGPIAAVFAVVGLVVLLVANRKRV